MNKKLNLTDKEVQSLRISLAYMTQYRENKIHKETCSHMKEFYINQQAETSSILKKLAKLAIFVCLMSPLSPPPAKAVCARGDNSCGKLSQYDSIEPKQRPYEECVSALSACDTLAKAQNAQITVLQGSIKLWKKQAEEHVKDDGSVLSAGIMAGGLAGAVGGFIVNTTGRGAAIGGLYGAALGGVVGLFINAIK